MEKIVGLSVDSGIGIVTMNHGPVNAIDHVLARELSGAVEQAINNDQVRVLLITSAIEGVFMAGADIKMMSAALSSGDFTPLHETEGIKAAFNTIQFSPKPVVAAINGHALGGGCELALACDFRIMAKGTKMGLTEVLLGIIPGAGGTQRIIRMVPRPLATRMLLEGLRLDAEKALEVGLADLVVDREELLKEALKFAGRFSNGPSVAYAALKRCINEGGDTDFMSGLELERDLSFRDVITSADAKEGLSAFVEKRPPRFSGR